MRKCLCVHISGKVQGVFFRAATKNKADALGIAGVVMNLADGRVYAEAEGEDALLAAFVDWCRQGPPRARVDTVEIREIDLKGFAGFEILR